MTEQQVELTRALRKLIKEGKHNPVSAWHALNKGDHTWMVGLKRAQVEGAFEFLVTALEAAPPLMHASMDLGEKEQDFVAELKGFIGKKQPTEPCVIREWHDMYTNLSADNEPQRDRAVQMSIEAVYTDDKTQGTLWAAEANVIWPQWEWSWNAPKPLED